VAEPGVGDIDPEHVRAGLGGGDRDGTGTGRNVKNTPTRGHACPIHQQVRSTFE
jgi:hypothetical protein